jgi:hypothetical protein
MTILYIYMSDKDRINRRVSASLKKNPNELDSLWLEEKAVASCLS